MFRILFSLCLFSFGINSIFGSYADSAALSFDSKTIDFQVIYEADGSVSVTFEYTNNSSETLIINRLIANGFVSTNYPKDSIMPGDSGQIEAIINPFGKTGYFKKSINVFTNSKFSPVELQVRGKIVSGTYKSSFKYQIGGISFKQYQLNFGYLFKGKKIVRYIPVLNTSDKALEISFANVPEHLLIKPKFKQLLPGNRGLIEISYNINSLNDWDFVIDKVQTIVKGDSVIKGHLMITANIREDFSRLSEEQRLNKPIVSIPIKVFNYDTISSDVKVKFEFPVYNFGTRELNIRAVKPTCGCTAVMPQKSIIHPGDSTTIVVEFNSQGFTGLSKNGVTVITNDPHNYKHFLWITGYIE